MANSYSISSKVTWKPSPTYKISYAFNQSVSIDQNSATVKTSLEREAPTPGYQYEYQNILDSVNDWNENQNCGIVFGATKLDELKSNINKFGNLSILLPGVGAQGGSLEDVSKTFKDNNRKNYLVNVSRGIIYKSSGEDFAEAARNEIISLNKIISSI